MEFRDHRVVGHIAMKRKAAAGSVHIGAGGGHVYLKEIVGRPFGAPISRMGEARQSQSFAFEGGLRGIYNEFRLWLLASGRASATKSMSDTAARTFTADFKRFFLRGLVVLLPSVLTLWIVVKAYQFVDSAIAEPINHSVRLAMSHTARFYQPMRGAFDPTVEQIDAVIADAAVARGTFTRDSARHELRATGVVDPTEEQVNAIIAQRAVDRRTANRETVRSELRYKKISEWWRENWYMNLIGLIVAIVAVYVAGRLLGGFLGRRVYRKLEGFLTTLPVFKQVYPYVKQIVDFLFSDDKPLKFNRVVAVQYPRKGIWSVGFQTGPSMRVLSDHAEDAFTVFIPSSPTPFTGYTITVARADLIEIPISVEEALRFVVSGGVLLPDHQNPDWPQPGGSSPATGQPKSLAEKDEVSV